MHLKFARAVLQHHRLISDGHIPGSSDVSLRAGPPYADHLIARITRGRGVLECGAVHHAPAPKQHVIRFILANAPPLRLLFETAMRHWDATELEVILLGEGHNRCEWLFAIRTVVKEQSDLLALQPLKAARLLADMLDYDVRSRPIRSEQWKIPHENGAIL